MTQVTARVFPSPSVVLGAAVHLQKGLGQEALPRDSFQGPTVRGALSRAPASHELTAGAETEANCEELSQPFRENRVALHSSRAHIGPRTSTLGKHLQANSEDSLSQVTQRSLCYVLCDYDTAHLSYTECMNIFPQAK